MNFYDYALKDLPRASYKLNSGGTALVDVSGNGNTLVGTPTFTSPIVSGNTKSVLSSTATSFGFKNDVWRIGRESFGFSLECVMLPLVNTGRMRLMSHSAPAVTDGIWMDADNIGFGVIFTSGRVDVTWPLPDFVETYHIVATYTPSRLQLWINGEMVSETTIPADYPVSKFNHGSETELYTGTGSVSTDKVVVDALNCYNYVLTEDQIKKHFAAARDAILMDYNVGLYGGTMRDGTERLILQQKRYGITEPWATTSMTQVSATDNTLKPMESQETATLGQSQAGVWIGALEIHTTDLATIAGVKVEWNGDGNFTVQTSLDGGSTYTAVKNGELAATSQGINPADKILLVKVTFTGGVVNDISTVRDMTLTAYTDNNLYGSDTSKALVITGAVSTALERNQPIESNSRAGIHGYGGTLRLYPDTSETPVNTQTVEFWVNPHGVVSGTAGILLDNRPYAGATFVSMLESNGFWNFAGLSALYINGVSVTSNTVGKKNEWQHVVAVFAASNNVDMLLLSGNMLADVNLIATYPTALTAGQIATLYAGYSAKPFTSIVDPATVTIFDPATPFVMTSVDWATLPQ